MPPAPAREVARPSGAPVALALWLLPATAKRVGIGAMARAWSGVGRDDALEPSQVQLVRMISMQKNKNGKLAMPEKPFSFQNVPGDLQDTHEFLTCPLFSDYVTFITESRLEAAKKEKGPKKCLAILKTLNKLPSLPESWRSRISIGMTVFDDSISTATQARYILHNESAAELVFDWWPKGVYAICARIVSNPGALKLSELAWGAFSEALELLVEAKETETIEDQVFISLLSIVGALTKGGKLPLWVSAILRETCGLMFGVSSWQLGDQCFDGVDFESFAAKEKVSLHSYFSHQKTQTDNV